MSGTANQVSGLAIAGILQAAALAALFNGEALAEAAGRGAIRLPTAAFVEDASLPVWLAPAGHSEDAPADGGPRASALEAMPPFATFLVGLSSAASAG